MKNGCRLIITEGYGDKVHDLHVMKLMVKKEYIFSCYESAVIVNQKVQRSDSFRPKQSLKVGVVDEGMFSYSHTNSPDIFCSVINHVECYDPIFR